MSDQDKKDLVDNTTDLEAQMLDHNESIVEQSNINDKLDNIQTNTEENVDNTETDIQVDDEISETQTEEQETEQADTEEDADSEDEVEGYEREDSEEGIITNITEITQQQATHITDVVYNGLLGDYDQYGKYTISDEITKELAHMPKTFVRKDKFGTYLQSKVGDKTFNFCVTPAVKKENGDAYCYLQLLEEVSYTNGYIIDTKTTTVATYEYIYSDVFYDWVASAFNIDQDEEGEPDGGRKYVDTQYIELRLKYLNKLAEMTIEIYEDLDESYFNQRLLILNELPEGAVILAELNKERAKIDKYFVTNSRRKYKALNDLLNSILDGPAGMKIKQNAEYNQKMAEVNQKYLNKLIEIHTQFTNTPEIKALLEYEAPIKKMGFDDDLPRHVKKGDTQAKKKSGGKSKRPSVPKPDKYKLPKGSKPKKPKKKDDSIELDILEKYKLNKINQKKVNTDQSSTQGSDLNSRNDAPHPGNGLFR